MGGLFFEFRIDSRTLKVPSAFISKSSLGFVIDVVTATWAAKWRTASVRAISLSKSLRSRLISPFTIFIFLFRLFKNLAFSTLPFLEKLSKIVTFQSFLAKYSAELLPIKPAPPVINILFLVMTIIQSQIFRGNPIFTIFIIIIMKYFKPVKNRYGIPNHTKNCRGESFC